MNDFSVTPRRPATQHGSVLLRQLMLLNGEMEFAMRRSMDLNDTDFAAMQHLLKHRSMTPSELAHALHLTGAATTAVIDRLALKGHVQRSPHPTDRRRTLLAPSADSIRSTMARVMPMVEAVDAVLHTHDFDDRRVIEDFLSEVVQIMKDRVRALDHGGVPDATAAIEHNISGGPAS